MGGIRDWRDTGESIELHFTRDGDATECDHDMSSLEADGMNYKILDPSDWSKLERIIPAEYLPSPEVAAAAVAEDEESGQIVGVLFLQLALRLEPLVIKDS